MFAHSRIASALLLGIVAIGFVLLALGHRPDNPVEAELVFEALRVARGQALYVDPALGAWEAGGPPSRYFVLYTPIWPWLLGHLASPDPNAIRMLGRAVASVSWLGIFFVPLAAARRERRGVAATAALVGLGVYFLARNAPSATPDTLAVALACLGLARAAKQGKVDGVAAVLLAIAPLVKPSCLGVAAGAGCALLVTRQRGWRRSLVAGAGAFAALALFCHVVSEGHWLAHIVRSTGQPLVLSRFFEELGCRFVVLGAPHVTIAVLAIRRRAPLVLTAPLVASIAWSSFSMAKLGSGTNYWLEPTMAAVVALVFMPARPAGQRVSPYLSYAASVGVALVALTSVPAYAREVEEWRVRRADFASVDRHCARAAGEIVVSSEAALELALDGRLTVPDWQSSFLARRGAFPAASWGEDLRRPEARWLVLTFDPSAPSLATSDPRVERSAFCDLLRPVVLDTFTLDARIGPFFVFRRQTALATVERQELP